MPPKEIALKISACAEGRPLACLMTKELFAAVVRLLAQASAAVFAAVVGPAAEASVAAVAAGTAAAGSSAAAAAAAAGVAGDGFGSVVAVSAETKPCAIGACAFPG